MLEMTIIALGFGGILVALTYAKNTALWRHLSNLRHYLLRTRVGSWKLRVHMKDYLDMGKKCCINYAVSLCQQRLQLPQSLW